MVDLRATIIKCQRGYLIEKVTHHRAHRGLRGDQLV
jgi:hypothetical protein